MILLTRRFTGWVRQNCVINMLDQKVTGVTPDFFSYTISKLALHNATRMLAMSLWPKTRVNDIAPGLVLEAVTRPSSSASAPPHAAGRRPIAA
jgi:NAD(P)-dependent dehydrogenase (short-subunit alcohol dehydrogenase family)